MAKKTKKVEEKTIDLGKFVLCNSDKYERVINGVIGPQGRLMGGLGKDASPEAIIAEYDKIAGLNRTKDGQNVAMGSFYDFEKRKARTEPQIAIAQKPNLGGIQIRTVNMGDEQKKGRKSKKVKNEDE